MRVQIFRKKLANGHHETRVQVNDSFWFATGSNDKASDTGLLLFLAEEFARAQLTIKERDVRMNDYSCPECKGTGETLIGFPKMSCYFCNGTGRLPDRRSKTISDRRKYDSPGMERRKNFTFTDRRRKI